jgi:hypothetical protein
MERLRGVVAVVMPVLDQSSGVVRPSKLGQVGRRLLSLSRAAGRQRHQAERRRPVADDARVELRTVRAPHRLRVVARLRAKEGPQRRRYSACPKSGHSSYRATRTGS